MIHQHFQSCYDTAAVTAAGVPLLRCWEHDPALSVDADDPVVGVGDALVFHDEKNG